MGNVQAFHFDDRCRKLPSTIHSGQAEFSLKHDRRRRSGLVHFPRSMEEDPARLRPVVFCFHGAAGHAQQMADLSQLASTADIEDFICVFPNGTGQSECQKRFLTWNVGPEENPCKASKVDDVGFFVAMLDRFQSHWPIDASRVYVTGFSNGAAMCYRLASDPVASQRIAAIAPVSGVALCPGLFHPTRAMPILHIHSKDDPLVLYDGGKPKSTCLNRKPRDYPAAHDVLAKWVRHNNGLPDDEAILKPAPLGTHREAVIGQLKHTSDHMMWPAHNNCGDIEHIVLSGAGHQWPSASGSALPRWLERYCGPPTTIVDANTEIWQFCKRFALPDEDGMLTSKGKQATLDESEHEALPAYADIEPLL
eukprot:m.223901 g.223901  ORF g.223901 m.223901 type:complete len:365 (+) comp17276_c0_seq2:108-1202(+)